MYLGLAMHAELDTGRCRPAAPTLGGYADVDERTVRAALAVLEDVGYIQRRHRPGKAPECKLLPPPPLPDDVEEERPAAPEPLDDVDEQPRDTPGNSPGVVIHTPDNPPADPGSLTRPPRIIYPTNENQGPEPRTTTSAAELIDQALLLHATTVVVGENDPTIRSAAAVARSRIALGMFDDDRQALTTLAAGRACSTPQDLLDAWRHHLDADRRAQAEAEARRRCCPACDGHGLILDDDLTAHPCPTCTPKGLSRA